MKKRFIYVTTLLVVLCSQLAFAQDWEQVAKILASDRLLSGTANYFGWSVDIEGDYAISGAPYQNLDEFGNNPLSTAGAAYIFKKEGNSWVQKKKLVPEVRIGADQFGRQVALSGDYAIVSSRGRIGTSNYGAVYVFKREGEDWVEKQILVAPVRSHNEMFGFNSPSIDIDGDYIVVGAHDDSGNEDDSEETVAGGGGVYIFKRNGEVWEQQQKILASDRAPNNRFGYSVAIIGNRIVVGATFNDNEAGSVYVFKLEEDIWQQEQKIVASDRTGGDTFGNDVSISGNYIAVGNDIKNTDYAGGNPLNRAGAAYIYYFNGDSWEEQAKITPSDREADNFFGRSLGINGDEERVIVGAYGNNKDEFGGNPIGNNAGAAYVFKKEGALWVQEKKLIAEDRKDGARFGDGVAIDSGIIIVAASYDRPDEGSSVRAGAAYIFKLNIPVESIMVAAIEGEDTEIYVDETLQLEAAVLPEDATNQEVVWSVVTGGEFASVSESGLVTGLSAGVATIRAASVEDSEIFGEIEVTVLQQVESITVTTAGGAATVLCADVESLQLEAAVLPANASNPAVVWSIVSGLEYVLVDENGLVTILGAGTAVIRAASVEFPDIYGEITITINELPVLNLVTTDPEVCAGTAAELYATSEGNVIFWYAHEEDEEYLYHGNLFITEELTETTTYWVEAYNISTGCSSERIEVTVTVNPVPGAPIAVSYQTVEEGTTLADLDVEADGILTWYANEALTVILPDTTLVEENTIYYVTQTIAGCESEAIEISVGFLGLTDINGNSLAVYPNPTAGIVKIQSKVAVANIDVFSISGQRVTSVKAVNEVNLSGYSSGTYVVRITLENGEVVTKKVVKK